MADDRPILHVDGDAPTGLEDKSVEELEALSRVEDAAATEARLAARMAELAEKAAAETAATPADPNEGKVQLAGHWVGPSDLIPYASAECPAPPRGCGGSGVATVTRAISPGQPGAGKPVLSKEICACAIQGFLDRHDTDLKAIVTAPGIRMPKFRLSKDREKVKARTGAAGADAEARAARIEAEIKNLEQDHARVLDRMMRRTEPHQKALAKITALGVAAVVRAAENRRLVGDLDRDLVAAQERLVEIEGRLHEARQAAVALQDARDRHLEAAVVTDAAARRYELASARVTAKRADVERRYRPEMGPLEQKLEARLRKLSQLRRYAGPSSAEENEGVSQPTDNATTQDAS